MRRDQPRIVAHVNGEPALLVFDTGAGASVILRAAVARLHPREDPDHTLIAAGVGGTSRAHPLIVDSFEVGGLALRDQRFGTGDIGAVLANPAPDGMLGNDILSGFDIDLDLADGQATLYRARECPRGAPPWTGPYATVPLLRDPGFAPLYGVPIELDGYTLMATIDTGSETTVISSAAAAAIGITPAMLAGDPGGNVSGLGRETLAARRHTFHALSIGTLTIADPRLSVFPLPDFAGDVLLGTDIMRHHRVWLAYATHRMLISLP
jgi:predicted aspartyl protease